MQLDPSLLIIKNNMQVRD